MQPSTDHLSNVMAKLVMGSAVKVTLRKCEEQWRKDGTFHEEDIQQKLQMLETLWHKYLKQRHVDLRANDAQAESAPSNANTDAALRKRARLREQIPKAEQTPSQFAPAQFMPPTVPLQDVLVTYHPVPAARPARDEAVETRTVPGTATPAASGSPQVHPQQDTPHGVAEIEASQPAEEAASESRPEDAETTTIVVQNQPQMDVTPSEVGHPMPAAAPSTTGGPQMSALEQFLLSDHPLSATAAASSADAAMHSQPMPSLDDELFDENVDEYLNELGELDEDFDDAMLSSIATELPAAARHALRQVVKDVEVESVPELTEEERRQLAQNVIVEIEPGDSYVPTEEEGQFVDDSAINDAPIDAYAIGRLLRINRKANPWIVRLKDVLLRIGEKDYVYKQFTLKIDAEDFGAC